MILCYIPNNIDDKEIDRRVDLLLYKYDIFFIENDDIIISTETNQKLLRLILKESHIKLFWIYSLDEIPFTPTQISELILFCISNGIDFHSEMDKLYYTNGDIELVYPQIFEIFRDLLK
ncbi:hypothetical protein CPG37_10805 [Malaciobacter canalis]|uniref:Uncharacterized protein n=1 Tax=Malaciobacter canalis TaxID=1912871 RepID=A0ABX4LMI5_9BACT|nr:hypothetical protein [Malaciobacter canalis]PHO09079.1 hypothetical protein CPG37_10805 [Malaciobacter canalis]QEE31817.1 hypothetical protein ACAN_0306 [Malaciobacter canalis]